MDKVKLCATAAAEAGRVELRTRYITGCWNSLGNRTMAELGYENMLAIGPPKFSSASHDLAKQIQNSLGLPQVGMSETIPALSPPAPLPEGGTSTDMGDVSWLVPRVSFSSAVWVAGAPPHNWANASTAGSEPGHTALMQVSKWMAATAVDLITQPDVLKEVRAEFDERTKTRKWSTMLPAGTEPPLYEPPPDFLRKTAESVPARGRDVAGAAADRADAAEPAGAAADSGHVASCWRAWPPPRAPPPIMGRSGSRLAASSRRRPGF